eukprot:CAMPEP_0185595590 /NCGR_PEP_ID=MMETSP0434-20130131/79011_1 /TAXON_ID=626734 ORGANISM="Favella taraikaensis, Strain Fe Narragansett Bay" /NCGR_SAMPLE_ID=MMETSP0434 /ASSEMBLY_ACC=CAM_ASM_000379 /LENGTH=71 /DNA_ID=CAMNT_0028223727 /DNA_START=1918 /DNA_END=2133 /DNA_ORIENTATION=-
MLVRHIQHVLEELMRLTSVSLPVIQFSELVLDFESKRRDVSFLSRHSENGVEQFLNVLDAPLALIITQYPH